jgi:plastocyanin
MERQTRAPNGPLPEDITRSPNAPQMVSTAPRRLPSVRSSAPLWALALALSLAVAPALAAAAHVGPHGTQDEMRRLSQVYWATHAPHGGRSTNTGTAVTTFQVLDFAFDNGSGNFAEILVGETVGWQWAGGFHTTTNGEGFSDPAAGTIWNFPIDEKNSYFEFTFGAAGRYPFFCQVHGTLMRGVVQVNTATSVEPGPGEAGRIGFVSAPAPNPTRERVTFRFGLAKSGRVQLRVLDAQGRLVAQPIDESFGAGTYSAVWDGRTRAGQPAKAGVYYLTLSVPGARQTRNVALQR